MPAWSPPALAAALFIAVHYLLLRAASGRVADRVGALVLETAAALGIGVSFLLGSLSGSRPCGFSAESRDRAEGCCSRVTSAGRARA